MSQANLHAVDWSKLPAPEDDGAAAHLMRRALPALVLPASDGSQIDISKLDGRTVVFIYPMMGKPGVSLPEGWDDIPGARGCTPQSCAFRDLHAELLASGPARVFGLSTQTPDDQREAAERLHLPFALLSDASLAMTSALSLPTMHAAGQTLLKRITLILDDTRITKVFYPVFPPDRNAGNVLVWLKDNPV